MNEKKYVEVYDLLQHLPDEPYKGAIRRVLLQAPAADVVEVLKCKNCYYFKRARINEKGFKICPISGMEITDYDFCSYGDRGNEDE